MDVSPLYVPLWMFAPSIYLYGCLPPMYKPGVPECEGAETEEAGGREEGLVQNHGPPTEDDIKNIKTTFKR